MKHYNPSIAENFARIFNLKSGDQPSNEVLDYVTPTIQLNHRINIIRNDSTTTSGTRTVYTTPSDKDFYLTHLTVALSKNAACDVSSGSIAVNATIDGVLRTLAQIPVITLTAERADIVHAFTYPIKIDRNVAIQTTGSFTAGAMTRSTTFAGYTVEVTK